MGCVLSPQALYKMNTKRSRNKSASYPLAASDLAVCLWRNSPSPVYTCPADAGALWLLPSHPPHQGKTVCALTCLIWSLQREREREWEREKVLFFLLDMAWRYLVFAEEGKKNVRMKNWLLLMTQCFAQWESSTVHQWQYYEVKYFWIMSLTV